MPLSCLVEDIHHPCHVGDNRDRGGNDTQVRFFDRGSNMHRVWDSDIIERAGTTEAIRLAISANWIPSRTAPRGLQARSGIRRPTNFLKWAQRAKPRSGRAIHAGRATGYSLEHARCVRLTQPTGRTGSRRGM
jgi:hypothetical protein